MKKKIAIIGSGPWGLTAAMLLAKKWHAVDIFEKSATIGWRNSRLTLAGKYHFDRGPTFLMMKPLLDEVFEMAWEKTEDYLDFQKIDPMYELHFTDKTIAMTSDHQKMRATIAKAFPWEEKGFDRYLFQEEKRIQRMLPCLKANYSTWNHIGQNWKHLLKVLPHLSLAKSLYQVLSDYFTSEELKLCFTFQAKYLGMSPWNCPGAFSMLSYAEHKYGIYHVTWWLSEISKAMEKVSQKYWATIHLNSPIKKIITKNGIAVWIQMSDDNEHMYDTIIINADFGTAMTQFFDPRDVPKYTEKKLNKKRFSCSTFMVYLALDIKYDTPFHSIYFADKYRENLDLIHKNKPIDDKDFSFYVRNASTIDSTLAPKWHSGIYVLVPMSNLRSSEVWNDTLKNRWYETILDTLEKRAGMADIRNHLVASETISPLDWEKSGVYLWATFNLTHNLSQMLYFRPHNEFECVDNCYLVWGGTHPGSGLPTIYESARIVSDAIG